METIGRRQLLQICLAASAVAAAGLPRAAEAAISPSLMDGSLPLGAVEPVADMERAAESLLEPTQGVVVRRGRWGRPRVIIRPGPPRRRRWRLVCRRRNGRLVCRRRWWW